MSASKTTNNKKRNLSKSWSIISDKKSKKAKKNMIPGGSQNSKFNNHKYIGEKSKILCSWCNKNESDLRFKCNQQYYCSKLCQKNDWFDTHEYECKKKRNQIVINTQTFSFIVPPGSDREIPHFPSKFKQYYRMSRE